jgi:hypothetical protein
MGAGGKGRAFTAMSAANAEPKPLTSSAEANANPNRVFMNSSPVSIQIRLIEP